ncbi:MAG TPA: electron transport complex subunit RsxG [Hyphomicrobiales bacterium]|nr:electron transport complex subunit RsxG [Hyphomicrobiales bacterium]
MNGHDEARATQTAGTSPLRHPGLRLGTLALLIALVLALLAQHLRDNIAAQQQAVERAALAAVLPPTNHDNDLLADRFMLDPAAPHFIDQELLGLRQARAGYIARRDGRTSGVILPFETAEGFNGPIVMLVGLDREGVITGVRVTEHRETPDMGGQIELDRSRWILSFDNRSLDNTDPVLWRVKRDGGEFDQFVGATITPRAVVNAVQRALQFFARNREALLALPAPEVSP